MDVMLAKLDTERKERLSFMESLGNTAAAENRDLSTNELELYTRAKDRLGVIDAQIETLTVDGGLSDAAQQRLAALAGGTIGTPGDVEYKSPGAYLRDYLATLIGEGSTRHEAEDRLRRYHRAAAHITTGQFAGVFPDAIVGPLINTLNTARPLTNAIGVRPVPAGPSFRRPRLSDPDLATSMGEQANQKDELVSKKFDLLSDTVNLRTLGGYVNVARQVIDWGVATMDQIVDQLAARYSYATERATLAEMALSTGHVPLAAGADAATTIAAIYEAAGDVYTATGSLPTLLAMGPQGWGRMGALTTVDGQPIFPYWGGSAPNVTTFAQGSPAGLQQVVTPAITTEDLWVLNGLALEVYEQQVGQLSVVEPSVLGVQCAFAGYYGSYRPVPNGAVRIGV